MVVVVVDIVVVVIVVVVVVEDTLLALSLPKFFIQSSLDYYYTAIRKF